MNVGKREGNFKKNKKLVQRPKSIRNLGLFWIILSLFYLFLGINWIIVTPYFALGLTFAIIGFLGEFIGVAIIKSVKDSTRRFALIISIFTLIGFPLETIIGVITLFYLTRPNIVEYFKTGKYNYNIHKPDTLNKNLDDHISLWWIIAGILQIGLIGVPYRLSKSSSTHKRLAYVFILLFILTIISGIFIFAGVRIVILGVIVLEVIILLVFFLLFKNSDKPFSDISIYILIGLILSFLLTFMIYNVLLSNYSFTSVNTILNAGMTKVIPAGYYYEVQFTIYNSTIEVGSYSSTPTPLEVFITTTSAWNSYENYNLTPSFYYNSYSTNGTVNVTLASGNYTLIFMNNSTMPTTLNITEAFRLT